MKLFKCMVARGGRAVGHVVTYTVARVNACKGNSR